MATRETLKKWVLKAVGSHDGEASIVEVCKYIWNKYEDELRDSGDLFYTWGYDVRWAAQKLRDQGKMGYRKKGRINVWTLL